MTTEEVSASATAWDILDDIRCELPAIAESLNSSRSTLAIIQGRVTEAEQGLEETAMLTC